MTIYVDSLSKDRTLLTPSPEHGDQGPNQLDISVLETGNFGSVKILSPLGSGVSGSVYSGKTEKGVDCVVKRFLNDDKGFQRESAIYRALNRRSDSSFVKMICALEVHKAIVLSSTPNFTSLDKHPKHPSPEFLSRMAVCVTKGLVCLKEMQILHRDLKPANILVNGEGMAKIIDFGIAFPLSKGKCPNTAGSFLYRCPAANLGVPYGAEGDAWSLGVIVQEYVTGKQLFTNDVLKYSSLEEIRMEIATIHRDQIGEGAPEEFSASSLYPMSPFSNKETNRRKEFLKQYCATRGTSPVEALGEGWKKNRNLLFALAHLTNQCLQWHIQPIDVIFEDLKLNIRKS